MGELFCTRSEEPDYMSQYAIKWAVRPDAIDRPYDEARDELFNQLIAEVDNATELDTKYPSRKLSGDFGGLITVGTIFASNPQLFYQIYKLITSNSNAIIENIGFTGGMTVFETPLQFDINFNPEANVDIDLVFEHNERKVWKSSEYPKELEERDERQLVQMLNEKSDEDFTYEEFKEKYGSEHEED